MQITSDMLTTMNDAYRANPVMKAAALAMGHQPLNEVVFNCEIAAKGRFLFNHEVETMKVTNQRPLLAVRRAEPVPRNRGEEDERGILRAFPELHRLLR